jgi:outer membrane protein assembly factor BamD
MPRHGRGAAPTRASDTLEPCGYSPRAMMSPARAVVLLLLLASTGCKSMSLADLPWPSQLGWLKNFLSDREEVSYYPTARENFKRGMDLYQREEWQDAAKYFDYVRTKFPHSRYVAIAELRLADSNFGREKWLDSIDSYRAFIRLHPSHDAVPYATFQIAKSYYRQIPEDWFFLPPTAERDQSAAMDAVRALDDYLIRFPDHDRAEEARSLRKQARSRLAENEWYVAEYYADKYPKGAAYRYERIADLYPDVDNAPVGLLRAARIWEKANDLRRARVNYERLARDYPKFGEAKNAARAAKRLAEKLDAADKAAAAPPPAKEPPVEQPTATPVEDDAPPALEEGDGVEEEEAPSDAPVDEAAP